MMAAFLNRVGHGVDGLALAHGGNVEMDGLVEDKTLRALGKL